MTLTPSRQTSSQQATPRARDVYARRAAELTPEGALDVLHEEVGAVFGRVLENAGVFKWDEAGRTAQRRFLDSL